LISGKRSRQLPYASPPEPRLGYSRLGAEYGNLVLGEELRVLDGTMVVHLTPLSIELREDAGGAKGQGEIGALGAERR
jgi:hypothetical protein